MIDVWETLCLPLQLLIIINTSFTLAISTHGGNGNGADCTLPFTYHGRRYTSCTKVDHDQLWCATTNSYDKDKRWGNCVQIDRDVDSYAIEGLKAHNILRKIHGVEELKLDDDLSKGAESYARTLAESEGPCRIKLEVSPLARLGIADENIAIGCSDAMDYEMSPSEATAKWYAEACDKKYNFSKTLEENGPEKFDHFRKIIWKKNRLLGIGTAKRYCAASGRATCTIIVARYKDAGDTSSGTENMQKGEFDCKNCKKYEENILNKRWFGGPYSFFNIEVDSYVAGPNPDVVRWLDKIGGWWDVLGLDGNELF